MFKLTRLSPNIQPLIAINCQSINRIIIRTKRQTFSRRPVKILTDSGKDYFNESNFKEPISSERLEVNPNVFDRNDRKQYNKYYDERLVEDFEDGQSFDVEERLAMNEKMNQRHQKEKKENQTKEKEPLKQKIEVTQKRKEQKGEKVLKPKVEGIPAYEKLGEKNTEFINMTASIKNRNTRVKENIMVLEGKRLITDAIDANCRIKTIYFTKEENLVGIPNLESLVSGGTKLKRVFYKDMQLYNDVVTPPGVMAVCERPTHKSLNKVKNSSVGQVLPLILVGENIRDPGNLGTMIRCAAAVGAQKIVLMKGCADVWESKVLRSGAGSHFRIPIVSDIEWPLIFNHIPVDQPFDLFIADSNENFNNKYVKYEEKSDTESSIPSHTINTITKEENALSKQTFLRDDSYVDSNPELVKYRNLSMSSICYCDPKYYNMGPERPTVLVIGGETHGLSNQSYKLAYDYIGRKIKIPLSLGVDSLNSAMAAAVIMYEIRRQFECRKNCCEQPIDCDQSINA